MISMVHDPKQVMELVVNRLPDLLEVDAATIRLLDEATKSFVLGAAHGLSKEYLSRQIIDTDQVMHELRNGQPVISSQLISDDEVNIDLARKEGVREVLSLPILQQGKVIGLLRLLTREKREFTEAETGFAMLLAEQVGIAIANSRMFQEQANQLNFFQELSTISRLVNSTLDLNQILDSIVNKLPELMRVKACTIRLVDPATNKLELVATSGLSEKYMARGSIRKEDSIFTALGGEPVAIYDAAHDPRVNHHQEIEREGIKSILAIPIRNNTEVIGVMRLLTDQYRTFTPSEINFAVTVAAEGGSAIEKARTYRKITFLFTQIEEQESFLHTIIDSLWLSLVVVDSSKRVVMANRIFLEMQNLEEKDVLGRRYDALTPWQLSPEENCPVEQVLKHGASVAILEKIETDGNTSWFERHLTPITGKNGAVEFVIEAVRDITDQRLLEDEKMERVKLEGVVEMAGTAAHQLNSPLFAAMGAAQLLSCDLTEDEQVEDMDLIIRNLKKMSELTREMTEVTGFESKDYVGDTRIVQLQSDE